MKMHEESEKNETNGKISLAFFMGVCVMYRLHEGVITVVVSVVICMCNHLYFYHGINNNINFNIRC